jgi:hypothetical protein
MLGIILSSSLSQKTKIHQLMNVGVAPLAHANRHSRIVCYQLP